MIPRPTWRPLLLAMVLAACSPDAIATVYPTDPTVAPTIAATPAQPGPTAEPSIDPNGLPPTTTTGWWGDPDNPKECSQPGSYRIGYRVADLGDCAGMLFEGPPSITLDVGEDFDLHMTISAEGAPPVWPLPEAEDELVAIGWLIFDSATMTYRGVSPGTTRLVTAGACFRGSIGGAPVPAPAGTCPVLVVNVRPIDTECVDLPADDCRAVGAAAVLRGWGVMPGQRIVGWVARPAHFLGDASCGDGFATVTLKLKDPDAEFDVSIGRLEPEPSGEPRYTVCTY